MKSFSERKGFKKASEVIQSEGMSAGLRNSIWNALDIMIWSDKDYVYPQYGDAGITPFARALWNRYFKLPIDRIPRRTNEVLEAIRDYFFKCDWFEVYDFLEFVVAYYAKTRAYLAPKLNYLLERELSGFRFVDGTLTDITNEQELEMLDSALADDSFAGVSTHLKRGLELYSSRESPDYRNSIKESISAVEALARIVAKDPKATLGDALKSIDKRGKLHTALKDGFSKLYGYTSDEGGIRHAMLDEPNLTSADARYFLLSCTSFIGYLKSQMG